MHGLRNSYLQRFSIVDGKNTLAPHSSTMALVGQADMRPWRSGLVTFVIIMENDRVRTNVGFR